MLSMTDDERSERKRRAGKYPLLPFVFAPGVRCSKRSTGSFCWLRKSRLTLHESRPVTASSSEKRAQRLLSPKRKI